MVARASGVSALTFVSEISGTQHRIPLSALPIDSHGQIDFTKWAAEEAAKFATEDRALMGSLVTDLLKRGIVSAPPPDDSNTSDAKSSGGSDKGTSGDKGTDPKSGDSSKSSKTASGSGTGTPDNDSPPDKKDGP